MVRGCIQAGTAAKGTFGDCLHGFRLPVHLPDLAQVAQVPPWFWHLVASSRQNKQPFPCLCYTQHSQSFCSSGLSNSIFLWLNIARGTLPSMEGSRDSPQNCTKEPKVNWDLQIQPQNKQWCPRKPMGRNIILWLLPLNRVPFPYPDSEQTLIVDNHCSNLVCKKEDINLANVVVFLLWPRQKQLLSMVQTPA